jgi:hypothetical protein
MPSFGADRSFGADPTPGPQAATVIIKAELARIQAIGDEQVRSLKFFMVRLPPSAVLDFCPD